MDTASAHHSATTYRVATRRAVTAPKTFPPLEQVSLQTVPTEQAAYYLNRRPQTLRHWAMRDGTGPLRPVRIHGRLAWPVAAIRKLLEVPA